MKRKIYDVMLSWKNESKGKTALLIEGARRVGKSYIVNEFAKNEYKSYVLINFSEEGKTIKKLFDDLTNIPLLLQKIAMIKKIKLYERETLFVFDEIQSFPRAREAIKFLVKDGKYDFIETGSLISIHENVKNIIIPSEEEKISMYPMDFEEFCWALGDETTVPTIKEHFKNKSPLGEIHSSILEQFRKYMLVGGMPQVVDVFSKTLDFSKIEKEKKLIIDLYKEDISKKATKSRLKTSKLFEMIPSYLSKENKTVKISNIDKNGRISNYDEPLYWLEDSHIANICYNTTVPSVGLNLNADNVQLKVYLGDTGLLVNLAIDENEEIEFDLYSALLLDKIHFNEGMFAENIVAQILKSNGHKLYYHSFYNKNDKNRYEIDFLIRDGKKISPIEVKSGQSARHSSLDKFIKIHSKSLSQCYILHSKDLKKEGNILFLPIYMAICL